MQRTSMWPVLFSTLLLAGGCAGELTAVEGGDDAYASQKIHGGSAPNAWYHDAVVSLHQTSGSRVYTDPFCTGTLITSTVVVTAGHCLAGMSASRLAVYVGDNPYQDLSSHIYTVSSLQVYPSYNSRSVTNDIAVLTLSRAVTEAVTPVVPLPQSQGITSADIGTTVNFAGFGTTETNDYGEKLQVSMALGGLGCSVYGCPSTGDPNTQVSYRQTAGGPCSGDSGGPMFVFRGSSVYLGGVTSYGDYYCTQYGVSTRTDAFQSWLYAYAGITEGGSTGGGSTGGVCDDYTDTWTGSLAGAGSYAYEPEGNYFQTTSRGAIEAYLSGPSGADFDLYLYKYSSGSWRRVASSTSDSAEEEISYTGSAGYYIWYVYDYAGSGAYTLCTENP